MIGLAEGDVVAIFVQAILFGLYLASLAHCLRWQLVDDEGWRLRTKINWAMLIIAIFLFLLLTIDLAIRLYLTIAAVQGDTQYFKFPGVAVTVLECSAMLITDAVLIYRCWVVYARSWRIVCIPIFFWILLFASSIICIFYLTPLINPKNEESVFHAFLLEYYFWIVFYCANIATNIYATCMDELPSSVLALNLPNVAKGIGSANSSKRLHRVSRILTESGILYTSTSVLSLIGAITIRWPELGLFSNLTSVLNFSMAGITFNLILIRVAQDRSNTPNDRLLYPLQMAQSADSVILDYKAYELEPPLGGS
ncbi:hypothetical protein JOM56_002554 [Amanita muscaria]